MASGVLPPGLVQSFLASIAAIISLARIGTSLAASTCAAASRALTRLGLGSFAGFGALGVLGAFSPLAFLPLVAAPRFALLAISFSLGTSWSCFPLASRPLISASAALRRLSVLALPSARAALLDIFGVRVFAGFLVFVLMMISKLVVRTPVAHCGG